MNSVVNSLYILKNFILNKYLKTHNTREWLYNKIYNYFFYLNNIKYSFNVSETILRNNKNSKYQEYSNSLGHSPLLRLTKIFNKIENKNQYHFIDIGHGLGISTIFVFKKYNFKSFEGIEIDKKIFEFSIKNLKHLKLESKIKFKNNSAHNYKLNKDKKYVIYMYNPFKYCVLKKFLNNNLKIIKKNNSMIVMFNNQYEKFLKNYNLKKITISKGLNIYY